MAGLSHLSADAAAAHVSGLDQYIPSLGSIQVQAHSLGQLFQADSAHCLCPTSSLYWPLFLYRYFPSLLKFPLRTGTVLKDKARLFSPASSYSASYVKGQIS